MPNNGYSSNWVNAHQTRDERAAKYALCRSAGIPTAWARAMRDWSQSQLDRKLACIAKAQISIRPDGRLQLNKAVPLASQ